MMLADQHKDLSAPGFRLPGGKMVPWLESKPMLGIYQTQVGEVPHWLATASDSRHLQFAQLGDRQHGFVCFDVTDFNLTHREYAKLYKLANNDKHTGPPGTVKNRNT